jgi:hypothetical protein
MQNREGQFLFSALREASRSSGDQPAKMKLGQIKPANKNIDHTNRIVLAYPIFQAFRKQRDLLAIHSLDGLGQSRSHLPDPFACGMAATAASV